MAKKEQDNNSEDETPKKEEEPEDEPEDNDDGTKKKRRRKRKRKSKKDDGDGADEDEGAVLGETRPDDDTARTVFVEGIPYDGTAEQVAECLQKHTGIRREDITDLRFPTWQDSGRLRGYGHVVFSTVEIFQKVMDVAKSGEKMWMGKRYLSLQPAKPKGMGLVTAAKQPIEKEPTTTIMVKNLDYSATEDDVLKVMEQFGTVVDGGVRLARNYETRQSKGFAFVEYEDLKSSKKAIAQQKKDPTKPLRILKRPCLLDYDGGRIKGSFKTASGRLWSKDHKPSHKQPRRS
jgi:nucleolin